MQIQRVGVVGCGLMGHGIAQVAAQGGFGVVCFETEAAALERGVARIEKSLAKLADKAVEKGKADRASADANGHGSIKFGASGITVPRIGRLPVFARHLRPGLVLVLFR